MQLVIRKCKELITPTFILISVAVILFVLSYYPVIQMLVNSWMDREEYSHAFLTLPVVFYMVWFRRGALSIRQDSFTNLWFIALIANIFVYAFAYLTQLQTFMALSMFMTIVGTSIYLFGLDSIKTLILPLLLIALLIPIPDNLYIGLTSPLQLTASWITEILLKLINVPVLREGNILIIPDMRFEVIEACSGMRSMITLITLSVIMGYFFLEKSVSIALLVFAAIPTAIIMNTVRLLAMVLSFQVFRYDLTQGLLHDVLGVLIFGFGLVILYLFQLVLTRCEKNFI